MPLRFLEAKDCLVRSCLLAANANIHEIQTIEASSCTLVNHLVTNLSGLVPLHRRKINSVIVKCVLGSVSFILLGIFSHRFDRLTLCSHSRTATRNSRYRARPEPRDPVSQSGELRRLHHSLARMTVALQAKQCSSEPPRTTYTRLSELTRAVPSRSESSDHTP